MQKIILIAGPSGAGKTTISEFLSKEYRIPRVITHTTRAKRPGEIDGESYYFETDESFKQLHLFEHVNYGGFQYGSSKEGLKKAWEKNDLVSLVVDIEGVRSYIKQLGEQVYFLYVTEDIDILEQRLKARGDSPEKIAKRLQGKELNALPIDLRQYAHILVNGDWAETERKLTKIVLNLQEN